MIIWKLIWERKINQQHIVTVYLMAVNFNHFHVLMSLLVFPLSLIGLPFFLLHRLLEEIGRMWLGRAAIVLYV